MPALFAAAAITLALAAYLYWRAGRGAEARSRRLRHLFGASLLLAGGALTLRGGAVLGVPVGLAGLGLLGLDLRGMAGGGGARPGGAPPPPSAGMMSREEALELLGLDKISGPVDSASVHEAYRSLMKRVHPDVGGSDGLARKLAEARDRLLENG